MNSYPIRTFSFLFFLNSQSFESMKATLWNKFPFFFSERRHQNIHSFIPHWRRISIRWISFSHLSLRIFNLKTLIGCIWMVFQFKNVDRLADPKTGSQTLRGRKESFCSCFLLSLDGMLVMVKLCAKKYRSNISSRQAVLTALSFHAMQGFWLLWQLELRWECFSAEYFSR